MAKISEIVGIDEAFAQTLKKLGISTTETLLKRGQTPQGRRTLVEMTGFTSEQILDWVNRADLFRVRGIAEKYSDLLEHAGVDTVPELAQRNPDNLYETLVEINQADQLVLKLPTKKQVAEWVELAKDMERAIEY